MSMLIGRRQARRIRSKWVRLTKIEDFTLDMVYCKASRVSTMLDARGAMSLKMWEGA